jgi:hypothetical protein
MAGRDHYQSYQFEPGPSSAENKSPSIKMASRELAQRCEPSVVFPRSRNHFESLDSGRPNSIAAAVGASAVGGGFGPTGPVNWPGRLFSGFFGLHLP